MNGRDILIYLSIKHNGDWSKIYNDIVNRENNFTEDMVITCLNSLQSKAVTILDEDYPQILKQIFHPPFVLFYYGDLSLVRDINKCISVVGSRANSSYGEQVTNNIVGELATDFNIVSGLAKGIDSLSHWAAINNKGKTIAVLGSGIDNCYPSSNQKLYDIIKRDHLLISEYPNNALPNSVNFPIRNRIIAGLSSILLIPEAKNKSGTSITAAYALSGGRTICCVPNTINNDSLCNRLIKDGAVLVENAKDVIDETNTYLDK